MLRRVLHSTITWLIVPAGLAVLSFWIIRTSIEPLPVEQIERVRQILFENLQKQPDSPLAKVTPVTHGTFDEHRDLLAVAPSIINPPSQYYVYQFKDNITAIAETSPTEYLAFLQDLEDDYLRLLDEKPDAVLADSTEIVNDQLLMAIGAKVAVRSGDAQEAIRHLDTITTLSKSSLRNQLYGLYWGADSYFDTAQSLASITTSTAVLDSLTDFVSQHEKLITGTLDSVSQYFLYGYMDEAPSYEEAIQHISRTGYSKTEEYGVEVHVPYSIRNVIKNRESVALPWTRNVGFIRLAMDGLDATEQNWEKTLPAGLLQGLSGEDRLVAAGLLLETREARAGKYIRDRRLATRAQIVKAEIAARKYYLDQDRLPETMDDLVTHGYSAVPATDPEAVKVAINNPTSLPDKGKSFGPILLQETPSTTATLDAFLESPHWIKLSEAEIKLSDDASLTSAAEVTVTTSKRLSNHVSDWLSFASWMRSLNHRNDVRISKLTLTMQAEQQGGREWTTEELDEREVSKLFISSALYRQDAKEQFTRQIRDVLQHSHDPMLNFIAARNRQTVNDLVPFEVKLEITIPSHLTRIGLAEDAFPVVEKVQPPEPVYLAEPLRR